MRLTDSPDDFLRRYLVAPRVMPPLDPGFRPSVLARAAVASAIAGSRSRVPVWVAVEQPGGATIVRETAVFADGDPEFALSHAFCERLVKTLLWVHGGSRIWVDGPASLVAALRSHYCGDREASASAGAAGASAAAAGASAAAAGTPDPRGAFDASMMRAAYCEPLEVVAAPRAAFPAVATAASTLGGHLDGCRIGFDLGASDRKAAALVDGQVVFSEEILWDPARHDDPQWHFDEIMDSLRRAAAHLPRVDAIGGSAAGIYVDSEVRVASLFRAVPAELFERRVRGLFHELRAAWDGIPFVVVNDGEVTALAGAMTAGVGGLLGIAMGSSEAAGYVTHDGLLTPRLDELAFVPIDYAPDAPIDEWSGDAGCGARYFSQQCLPRLLPAAGITTDAATPLPERLVLLQRLMAAGDERAVRVYETIGTHLGYALLEYRDFYDFEHVLLLGRVTSGPGGAVLQSRAADVLASEAVGGSIRFLEVSERDKRHGQAVAAASLPEIRPRV